MKKPDNFNSLAFLGIVLLLYLSIIIFDYSNFDKAVVFVVDIFEKIIPILFLVFILMATANYFINPRRIAKYLGKESGIKGWIIAIFGGIISTGPIYLWYPLLNDLQKKGVRNGLIATFLYNRAIKIPLMPLMILYFGLKYLFVLTMVMIIFSVFQGIVVEKIMGDKK